VAHKARCLVPPQRAPPRATTHPCTALARSSHSWAALVTGSARSWPDLPFRSPCTLVLGACSGDRIHLFVARNATRPCSIGSSDRIRSLVSKYALVPVLPLLLNPCARSSLVTRSARPFENSSNGTKGPCKD
jgi:hypothetical protein